ncbi:MAG: kinaseassociated protein [Bacilli bacterium]|nr:kinaseassociated protein [Bacilli bacterium]
MSNLFQAGDFVIAAYKTGEYIGEIVEASAIKAAVKVLAVLKHPAQGDLHNPMQANVAFFHQRRALAYQEIALMPLHTISPYGKTIPDYKESLYRALHDEMEELKHAMLFAQKCLNELESLEKDYFEK